MTIQNRVDAIYGLVVDLFPLDDERYELINTLFAASADKHRLLKYLVYCEKREASLLAVCVMPTSGTIEEVRAGEDWVIERAQEVIRELDLEPGLRGWTNSSVRMMLHCVALKVAQSFPLTAIVSH